MSPYFNLGLTGFIAIFQNIFLSPRIRSDYNRNWPCRSQYVGTFTKCIFYSPPRILRDHIQTTLVVWFRVVTLLLTADRHSCGDNFAVNVILNLLQSERSRCWRSHFVLTRSQAQFCSKRDSKPTVLRAVTLLLTGHFVLTRSQPQFCTTRYSKSTLVGAVTFLVSTHLVLKRSRAQFCSKCDSKSTVVGAVTLLLKPFCYNTFSGTILQ